jgi:hypothetical protein
VPDQRKRRHDELVMNGVSVQMKLAEDLPLVQGDRVHTVTGYGQFDHQRAAAARSR